MEEDDRSIRFRLILFNFIELARYGMSTNGHNANHIAFYPELLQQLEYDIEVLESDNVASRQARRLIIVFLLPFPYDLISVLGLFILVNFLRGRSIMKRYRGTGGIKDLSGSLSSSMSRNDQNRPLKYYCIKLWKRAQKNCMS